MAKYRKKPMVIEAVQLFNAWTEHKNGAPQWMIDAFHPTNRGVGSVWWGDSGEVFFVETLEGVMQGDSGDWLLRGIKGELYPCKPDIFAATYEPVE